jgi:hypothetical protein
MTNALHDGVGNVQRIIGDGAFEVVCVIQQHCLDTFNVSQEFFPRLSNKVFPPSWNSVLPCIQQVIMFFEHPCTHLNTHCERMMGKSRSRHDNSSLSCSTACGDHHEGPFVPVPKSDDFI